jgi:hypothetical protein
MPRDSKVYLEDILEATRDSRDVGDWQDGGDGWSGAMNQSNERPDAWRVRLKKDEGQPMRLRRFSRQPGLLRGLLHRLSLAGER